MESFEALRNRVLDQVDLREEIEDDELILFRDTDAVVAHLQQNVLVGTVTGDGDLDVLL